MFNDVKMSKPTNDKRYTHVEGLSRVGSIYFS
jgi:hypothetical protein